MTQSHPHPLSLSRSARVPRSLDALIERNQAPKTPDTPNVDAVLLATLADAVRQLQEIVAEQDKRIDKCQRRVAGLEAREHI